MNKQKRLFIILVVVLAACLAGYMALLHYNKYKRDDTETESTSIEALSVDSSKVKSFAFEIDGKQYTVSRAQTDEKNTTEQNDTQSTESEESEDAQWVCDNDPALKLNTSKITTMLGCITSITATEKFDADTDMSDFGFDTPQNTITMITDDSTYTIIVGAKNAMLGEYYIKVNDNVYLANTTIPGQFNVTVDDITESE